MVKYPLKYTLRHFADHIVGLRADCPGVSMRDLDVLDAPATEQPI